MPMEILNACELYIYIMCGNVGWGVHNKFISGESLLTRAVVEA